MAIHLNQHDLTFILKQIKIAEAHSNGTPITEIRLDAQGNPITDRAWYTNPLTFDAAAARAVPDAKTPFGLRTVDGSYNNLLEGRELWGAADQPMPRYLDPNYIDGGAETPFSLGPGPLGPVTNTDYGVDGTSTFPGTGLNGGHTGNVVDTDPRVISNLVADMSANNPAALYAALVFAESADPYADLAELMAARVTQAQAAAMAVTAQTAFDAAMTVLNAATTAYAANADPAAVAGLIDAIQDAATGVAESGLALDRANALAADPNAGFLALAEEKGLVIQNGSLVIPNVAPDEGISAPFNAWMTFFGQFFDHGLDLISKGGNGSIFIPLKADDPLIAGADGILGNADDLPPSMRFMVLTRSETVFDENGVPTQRNTTTPFVDQNQTYTSHASHQVFLREYVMGPNGPVATGRLLGGQDGGLATWDDVKAQAKNLLGIELTDGDVLNIPLIHTDAYGEFIRGANGLPQIVTGINPDGTPSSLVSGSLPVAVNTFAAGAVRIGHAFLDDIAHTANPFNSQTGALKTADADNVVNDLNADGRIDGTETPLPAGQYDDELLGRHFITGDGRGNENFGLTAVHHIFHSEHNRQTVIQKLTILEEGDLAFVNEWLAVDIDAAALASIKASLQGTIDKNAYIENSPLVWDGERIFQAARFATEMQYQHLVFEEFARKVQPAVDPFVFNSVTDINPAIFAEFANVVYRFGHSMLTDSLPRAFFSADAATNHLDVVDEGLIKAFLDPVDFDRDGGVSHEEAAGAIVRGLTNVRGNAIDEFVVDALRNNLLGLPLDLAAMNIARGRDTGMPSLNQAREQLFAATGHSFLKPYANWTEFAVGLKNPLSVVNFIAAYGTHTAITTALTLADKRAAAWELVFGVEADGVTVSDIADRVAFINGAGQYATDKGGLDNVDLWIGGLAEKILLFGGMLGSTFTAIFEAQLEALQDADRFYYLTRTQGLNFIDALENNAFSKMIMANTDITMPGADGIRGTADDEVRHHIGIDSFAKYDHVLEVNVQYQQDYNGAAAGKDPLGNDAVLEALGLTKVERDMPTAFQGYYQNYLRFFGGEHVVLGGSAGRDVLIGDLGDDAIWGDAGNDYIEGGQGVDLIMGGAGDDVILDEGDDGDFIKGDAGDDVISSSNGLDILMGGEGKDVVFAGVDSTEIFAGEGDDFLLGGDGADFLLGNEGDDWLEAGGGFDTTAGDNSELFFNSTILGHDVMFAGSDEHDFDAESGDDIMVQGESVMRNEGMFGFDWASYQGAQFDADADMRIRIFTTEEQDILRNRFDKVEALSGGDGNDNLRGDDRAAGDLPAVPTVNNTETLFFKDELSQAGLARIEGLRALLGDLVSDVPEGNSEAVVAFTGGNILLGGGGSDRLQGNGGDDFIDGNARLNVRIRIVGLGEENDADNEIATIYSLKHTFTGNEGTFVPIAWIGKTMFELLVAREIVPSQMHIVREIIANDGDDSDIDTAVFNDNLQNDDGSFNYTITANGDGTVTVTHVNVSNIDDAVTGRPLISDGVDTLRNIERLEFRDQVVVFTPPQLYLQRTSATRSETFNSTSYTDNDGIWTDDWAETGDDGSSTSDNGQIRISNNRLEFDGASQGVGNGAVIQRGVAGLAGAVSATVSFDYGENIEAGETVLVEFSRDGNPANLQTLVTISSTSGNNTSTGTLALTGPFTAGAFIRFTVSAMDNDNDVAWVDNLNITGVTAQNVHYQATFTEGNGTATGADVPIASNPLIVENDRIVSARVVLTNAQTGDSFDIPGNLPGNINSSVQAIGGQIVVTLTGNEPNIANWQAALQAVEFRNNLQTPSHIPRVIQVTVNDGFLDSNIATTTINVVPVNDVPNAGNDAILTNFTGNFSVPVWMLLANDTDADGQALSITNATEGQGQFAVALAAGVINVTRTTTDARQFTYTVSDGTATDTANVSVQVDTTPTNGGNGAEILLGDAAGTVFNGNGGNDIIMAGGGNDTVSGGTGDDLIVWNAGDGRDLVDGGGNTDTMRVVGNATAETYNIYTRAAWLALAGNTAAQLNANTEIVIARGATNNAAIIAELDNIEEIVIDGMGGGDTFNAVGNFGGTSLLTSTITLNGGSGDDVVNFSALSSAHRIVFRSNGGNDTVIGNVRPQDVIQLAPGEDISSYSLASNGNGTQTFSNGTHSITFTGTVPPQFQNGSSTGGTALDDEDLEDLLDMVRDPAFDRDSSGYGNNAGHPHWGAGGNPFIRLTEAHYTDGASGIRETALTPREISDILSNQDNDGNGVEESISNSFGGTSLLTFFGQYFDHGLDFVAKGQPGYVAIGSSSFPIDAPRSNIVPGTGVNGVPAEYINNTSPYVDQNQAYGSHNAITDVLRKWEVGSNGQAVQTAYLLAGDVDATGRALLPTLSHLRDNYRVMTGGGELTSEDISNFDGSGQPLLIDFIPVYSSPGQLDLDAIGHYFIAGDGRANENVMLTSMHTIWARNHNYWVDQIKAQTDGAWTEAEYFEAARMMNIAEYQRVVFTEFATAMAGGFDGDDEHGFEGYDPDVDASISVEFSQAAYRFGHSMLNETISYVDGNGQLQQISLVQAFLNPGQLSSLGIDALIAGSVEVPHQAIDVDVVNALRNQLVGRPLDLAALNIFRGRDMGIAPFNTVRAELYEKTHLTALRPYTGWADFAQRNAISTAMLAKLQQAYPDGFETMDLWVGGLMEKPMAGQLGSTFGYIFLEQLNRLQHGDKLYYLEIFDDSMFTGENSITFAEIIERNTGLTGLPENVFDTDGSNAADSDDDDIFGNVDDEDDTPDNGDDDDDGDNPDDGEDDDQPDEDNDGDGEDDDEEEDDDDDEDDEDEDEDEDEDDDTPGGGDTDDDDDGDTPDDDDDGDGVVVPPASPSVRVGTPGADVLTGAAGADTIIGHEGDDVLTGAGGADIIRGGTGDDFIDGGDGRDVIFASAGNDDVFGGADADMVYGEAGDDRILAQGGDDLVNAGAGNDTVFGGEGNDLFVAEAGDGNDTYYGDDMNGGVGIDTLDMASITAAITADLGTGYMMRGSVSSTQTGTDTLWNVENIVTGSGNDTITASAAVNIMDGGAGNDTFRFLSAADANGDTILGFQPGDRLDLSAVDANGATNGNQTFTLVTGAFTDRGQLLVTYETRADGDYTVVSGNTTGNVDADFKFSIKGTHNLAQSDFNL